MQPINMLYSVKKNFNPLTRIQMISKQSRFDRKLSCSINQQIYKSRRHTSWCLGVKTPLEYIYMFALADLICVLLKAAREKIRIGGGGAISRQTPAIDALSDSVYSRWAEGALEKKISVNTRCCEWTKNVFTKILRGLISPRAQGCEKFLMRAVREEKRKESADSQAAQRRKSQVFARILLLFEQLERGSCFKSGFSAAAAGSALHDIRGACRPTFASTEYARVYLEREFIRFSRRQLSCIYIGNYTASVFDSAVHLILVM